VVDLTTDKPRDARMSSYHPRYHCNRNNLGKKSSAEYAYSFMLLKYMNVRSPSGISAQRMVHVIMKYLLYKYININK
jgi:hypothetical protein